MTQRSGSFRKGTRIKLRKNVRKKGKINLTRYFQKFKVDEQVTLIAEPAVQKGMYFPRYHGKVGKITGNKGKCYTVQIKDGDKPKTLIVHPVHLRRIKNATN